jgi:hypothetical protein
MGNGCDMGKKCKLFSSCPLRLFYSNVKSDKSWMKEYCEGNFKRCARYRLEGRRGGHHLGRIDKRLE